MKRHLRVNFNKEGIIVTSKGLGNVQGCMQEEEEEEEKKI